MDPACWIIHLESANVLRAEISITAGTEPYGAMSRLTEVSQNHCNPRIGSGINSIITLGEKVFDLKIFNHAGIFRYE